MRPTTEEVAQVGANYGIDVPSRAALQEIESSSRLRIDGDVIHVSMPLATSDDETGLRPMPLGFLLSARVLVTVRFSAIRAFDDAQSGILAKPPADGSAGVFATLIDGMVDFGADALEEMSAELAAISKAVFGDHPQDSATTPTPKRALRESLSSIGKVGNRLSRTRESLLGLQRIVSFVSERAVSWLQPEAQARLRAAREDLASLIDFEAHLSGKTQFLLDAILGFISTEQNDIFKILTMASVVGIPPTLIASMYGMNFRGMPELSWRWGYPYGLCLIALSIVVPIVWFKRRHWW